MELREFSSYKEMQEVHQKDIEAFPITYMFGTKSDEEIKEELSKIGAKCMAECVSVFGCGDIVRRVDVPKLKGLLNTHNQERFKLYEKDKLFEDAILYEMNNHEYSYTGDKGDTLEALGYTLKAYYNNERVREIWKKAEKRCYESSIV